MLYCGCGWCCGGRPALFALRPPPPKDTHAHPLCFPVFCFAFPFHWPSGHQCQCTVLWGCGFFTPSSRVRTFIPREQRLPGCGRTIPYRASGASSNGIAAPTALGPIASEAAQDPVCCGAGQTQGLDSPWALVLSLLSHFPSGGGGVHRTPASAIFGPCHQEPTPFPPHMKRAPPGPAEWRRVTWLHHPGRIKISKAGRRNVATPLSPRKHAKVMLKSAKQPLHRSPCLAIIQRWSLPSSITPVTVHICPGNAAKPRPQFDPNAAELRSQFEHGMKPPSPIVGPMRHTSRTKCTKGSGRIRPL